MNLELLRPGAVDGPAQPLAEGDPADDARAFRRCLGQFATGVTVITTEVAGERFGVTANSFSSLSLDPPLVLWSIAKTSRSFAAFDRAAHFAIHVLAEDQIHVSQRFSSSSADKYEGLACRAGASSGAPIIDGTAAVFECAVETRHDGGDHVILVGRVKRFRHFDRNVLLFVRGRYASSVDHPEAPTDRSAPSETAPPRADDNFYMLLFRAFHAMAAAFEQHRVAIGMPVEQSRVLIALSRTSEMTSGDIARAMYLSQSAVDHAVAQLVENGSVAINPRRRLSLTEEGRRARRAIAEHERAFEAHQLKDLPPNELPVIRDALIKIIG